MTWRLAADVAWVADDDHGVVYALSMPPAQPFALAAPLVDIWDAVCREEDPVGVVAARNGLETEQVRGEVEQALREMQARGLIERSRDG